ncbi:oocyte zinc finger protein XlCOF6.1-like [Bufo bufo]|uniref:oocyte zinc finger protein XlCOF6.1-like n=1 Tax=Bufo bufo TaxID=8384 RepID=UPI001ABE86E7|nr:oocyte zinc finger protein XlCOF6.1-like [Bufo bufo]
MAGASHYIIHDENSSDSDVCWLGPEDLGHLSDYKREDVWDVYSHERSFKRTFSSDEDVSCIDLYEDVTSINHQSNLQTKSNLRHMVSKRGRRAYKPRERIQSSDRSSPEKSIARERSTIDSAGNITLMTETIYKCNNCDKTFFTRSGYRKHQRNHSEDSSLTCSECGEIFKDLTTYSLHKEAHEERKPWSCTVCHKCFRLQSHLNKHERTHTEERPYTCNICGNCFGQSSNLTTHMKTHVGEKSYACSECGKSFARNFELEAHMIVHSQEVLAFSEYKKGFQRSFHQREVERYTCSECNKCFSSNSDLILHQRDHTGDKPYSCVICGEKFCSAPSCLRRKKTQSGGKTFLCGGCGRNFSNRDSYTSHSCVLIN